MPTDKYVIMANGDFLMRGADISFKNISLAGHRNLAAIFDLLTAEAMKTIFAEYRKVEIVNWEDTFIFGKRSNVNAD